MNPQALPTTAMWMVLGFFAVLMTLQAILMISAWVELRDVLHRRTPGRGRSVLGSSFAPRISVLVPAHDEEALVADTVESMLALEYPDLEVVVVNDGSSDRTFAVLVERFDLVPAPTADAGVLDTAPILAVYHSRTHPALLVIDKINGGKADALNAALSYCCGELVCAVDADTIVEPDALEYLVEPFLRDPRLVAAGGSVRPSNGCVVRHGRVIERRTPLNFLAGVQSVEYTRAFLFGRLGWNRLGGNIIVSGAFGLFSREAVIAAGGYLESTVGEDMELILRLRRRAVDGGEPGAVSFLAEPMAWTEVPESTRTLARQRNRWQRGLLDALWHHRAMIGRPRYRSMGLLVLPYYAMELLAPLVEVVGLVVLVVGLATGTIEPEMAVAFFFVSYGFSLVLSAVVIGFEDRLDGEQLAPGVRRRRFRWLLLEQFGYRQLTVVWRLWGMAAALRGDRRWGAQARRGLSACDRSNAPRARRLPSNAWRRSRRPSGATRCAPEAAAAPQGVSASAPCD